ncbi:ADP-ribosylation factor protein 3 [Naganishia albida]|nr:ADP-ribosylation factor protein 3 [Naganishia albida]
MYHLLRGFHEYMTRKDEFSIVIIGLDNAGKTTFLERVKSLYNKVPGLGPERIGPTVGQNIGQISLPSTTLRFFDLGGQRTIRAIWEKYYDECHAVVFVLDGADQARLAEAWGVFDSVITSPRLLNLPLLLVVNKQDQPSALSVAEVRESFEAFQRAALEGDAASSAGEKDGAGGAEGLIKAERVATLDVLGMSALTGDGVKDAIEWLYSRVQTARRM